MSIHRLLRLTRAVLVAALFAGCRAPRPPTAPVVTDPSAHSAGPRVELATAGPSNAVQASSDLLPVGSDDPVWGSATAPVTLLEFSDLQCPFCSRVNPTIKRIQAKYGPNQLRVVFKHNPLPFHPSARPAAQIADAVLRQGGSVVFFRFLDLAFEEQTKLDDAALRSWVGRVGLDPEVVLKRAALQETSAKLERDLALASKIGANGTPTFYINGALLVGAQPTSAFESLIDSELTASVALRASGTAPGAIYKTRVAANFKAPKPDEEEEQAKADLTIWKIPVKGAPTIGPADALVTIVEFFDYQCPYCRRVETTLKDLLARYPREVRLVLRQNPLPFHDRALPAANLALEARAEKGEAGFLAANRELFTDRLDKLEESDLLALGKSLKLDDARAKASITKNTHAAEIEADVDLASDFNAAGTPYFFINGQRLAGAQPLENFVAAVDSQLEVAKALVAAGTPRAGVYDEIMKHGQEPEPPEQKSMPAPSAENPTRGPANAAIVIHEFSDFQCPFCGRVEKTLAELILAFPNQLRFVWHDYPLPFHQRARPAAIMAREVRAQKGDVGFWKVHDLMFGEQGVDGALSQSNFDSYVHELRLDPARVAAALSDGRHDAVLAHDQALADAAGIRGTPAFVINGYYLSGAQPLSAFKHIIRYALAHPTAKSRALAVP